MSQLTELLKIEHNSIIMALREVKELGIWTETGQAKLMAIKYKLLSHLSKEDELLYPVLEKASVGDPELQQTLSAIYSTNDGILINEFSSSKTWTKTRWRFTNLSLAEYECHQRRKLIYSLYTGSAARRQIKVEFEPVLNYSEIVNEYNEIIQIENLGWIEAEGIILDDEFGSFMPSIYTFELATSNRSDITDIHRITSYVEEYRMQVKKGEKIRVNGYVEKVTALRNQFYQITLTYAPRYYEQVLKKI